LLGRAAPASAAAIGDEVFDCVIEADTTTRLGAPVAGLVSEVLVDRGDVVKAGQVVARLDAEVEVASLALASAKAENDSQLRSNRARAGFLQRKLERAEKLRESRIATPAQLDEADTDAEVARQAIRDAENSAELARLEARRAAALVSQRTVRSPIDGVVIERNLSAGEYRHEQTHILTIARIDPLKVEVYVPSEFYRQTAVGGQAEVMPAAPVGGSYQATVTVVDRVMDASSGTFGVRLALPNKDLAIPGGLRCRIRFLAPVR
jgi:RND family efflux transporter MFP subunit